MKETPDRAWFRRRLSAWTSGLLNEQESSRFEELREADAACRAAETEFALDPPEAGNPHIPTSLIARWPEAERTIGGLERELLKQHLGACASCRDEITMLGFPPTMGELKDAAEPSKSRVLAFTAPTPSFGEQRRRTDWVRYGLGAWGGLATAAAVLLFLLRGPGAPPVLRSPGSAPEPSGQPDVIVGEGATTSSPILSPGNFLDLGTERGGDAKRKTIDLPPGSNAIELVWPVPPPPARGADPGRARVVRRFLGPRGRVLAMDEGPYSLMRTKRHIILSDAGRVLSAGVYRLITEVEGADPVEQTFEVRISSPAASEPTAR